MEIQIDRQNGIPIYIQLKTQIKKMVEKGILVKGDKLLPERELAEKLNISRNRVSTAYKELEAENVLYSQQGKGTFVAGKVVGVREASRKDKLLKIIDLAMEEAISLGFSLDDFLTIAYVRAREKEEMMSKIRVAFIECNKEQLSVLIKAADLDHHVASIPVLVDELQNDPARIKRVLEKVEIIVTTPFHLIEVENFVAGMNKQIIDMTVEPVIATIVELARIEQNKSLGLICQSENFAREVKKSLEKMGLNNLGIKYTTGKGSTMEDFINQYDILITSPPRYKEVRVYASPDKKVIKFDYSPDRGSINMLKMALIDLRGE